MKVTNFKKYFYMLTFKQKYNFIFAFPVIKFLDWIFIKKSLKKSNNQGRSQKWYNLDAIISLGYKIKWYGTTQIVWKRLHSNRPIFPHQKNVTPADANKKSCHQTCENRPWQYFQNLIRFTLLRVWFKWITCTKQNS